MTTQIAVPNRWNGGDRRVHGITAMNTAQNLAASAGADPEVTTAIPKTLGAGMGIGMAKAPNRLESQVFKSSPLTSRFRVLSKPDLVFRKIDLQCFPLSITFAVSREQSTFLQTSPSY